MRIHKNYLKIFSLIFIISFCFLSQTIVYSAFSSTINLTGTAHARIEKDIRITDFNLYDISTGGFSLYEDFSINTISSSFTLPATDSGLSTIIYEVEVTNYGTIDVGILNIEGLPDQLSYELVNYKLQDKICDNTGKCNSFAVKTFQIKITGPQGDYQLDLKFDFRTYHKVTYTDINIDSSYPLEVIDGGNLNVTFKENLKKVSVLTNETEIKYYNQISSGQTITIENVSTDIELKLNKPAKLVSGTINKVGSEVCIEDQCFNIISNDGTSITMLAKYNLYVGGILTENGMEEYSSNATGKQDSTMIGLPTDDGYPRNGITAFSTSAYWTSDIYPYYVYNEKSIIYSYVENYKLKLQELGVTVEESRLIKQEELLSLGCSTDSLSCKNSNYNWLYSTSYWTATAVNYTDIWIVDTKGNFWGNNFSTSAYCGVRPVIKIPVTEIEILPAATIVSGNLDTEGSEICIRDECFYLISSDEDSVTMLAKYNLHVGNKYDDTNKLVKLENPTGKQDSTAKGWYSEYSESAPIIGSTTFSSTNYWSSTISTYPSYVYNENSSLYQYVENYKTYLKELGAEIKEARLIKVEELETLGCSTEDISCANSPYNWLSTTTYWTGSAHNSGAVWNVGTSSVLGAITYNDGVRLGVRPVITIPKWLFSKIITFQIDNNVYQAVKGMSWGEWIETEYNSEKYYIAGNVIHKTTSLIIIENYGNGSCYYYKTTDTIDKNKRYTFVNTGSCD